MIENRNSINLKAPGNWINDPNGFLYYKGEYHLFYQYFPYAPMWGTMHWGHAVSKDLVHWEHQGIALFPSKEYDKNGVFSGSAIEVDGQMYLFYTGEVYGKQNPENIHLDAVDRASQSQCLLLSEDGHSFDNFSAKSQVVPVIEDTEIADPVNCRDPKVFRAGGKYYMCLASTHLGREGVLVLFASEDAKNWEFCSRLQSKELGIILECPDLFPLGEEWFLMCSPVGNYPDHMIYQNQSVFQKMSFSEQTGEMALLGRQQLLDYGMELYAPQSTLDEAGRRVYIAWVRMACPMKPESNEAANGRLWNGMMTIPRLVELRGGVIFTPPHPAVRQCFLDHTLENLHHLPADDPGIGNHLRVTTVLCEGQEKEYYGYKIRMEDGKLIGDRSLLVPDEIKVPLTAETPYIGDSCNLEIFIDPDLIEIFVNDGQYVITQVTYQNAKTNKY